MPEISQIFDRLEEINEDKFDFDGELKKIKNPKTKLGDIIELSDHRILCGDSSKSDDLAKSFLAMKRLV